MNKKLSAIRNGVLLGNLEGMKSWMLNHVKEIEIRKESLIRLIGSAKKGTKLFEKLKKFPIETPLQLKDIILRVENLLILGVSEEDIFSELRKLSCKKQGEKRK